MNRTSFSLNYGFNLSSTLADCWSNITLRYFFVVASLWVDKFLSDFCTLTVIVRSNYGLRFKSAEYGDYSVDFTYLIVAHRTH
jgi:hypothetical protein